MSIIPNDLYKRGRQTYAIERYANFLAPSAYNEIIATSVGKAASFSCDQYEFVGVSNAAPSCGFTTVPFRMHDATQLDCVIAAELVMDGVMHPSTGRERVVFSDGVNSIAVYNTSSDPAADTLYSATIAGTTTSGVMINAFNIGANYSNMRTGATSLEYVRLNLRYRFDKTRNEFSVWLNDQIKGAVHFDGLSAFGDCTYQYQHEGYSSYSNPVYVKQIGLRLEC